MYWMNRIERGTYGGSLFSKRPCRIPMSGCFCSGAMNERIEWSQLRGARQKVLLDWSVSNVCWYRVCVGIRCMPARFAWGGCERGWCVKRCLYLLALLASSRERGHWLAGPRERNARMLPPCGPLELRRPSRTPTGQGFCIKRGTNVACLALFWRCAVVGLDVVVLPAL